MVLHFHTELPSAAGVPDWVHLLPAGEFKGIDGRGPYRAEKAGGVILASMVDTKLVVDENHSTDHALARGGEAPAVGWIVQMAEREDGIWGRVDWTGRGRTLMSDRAYRGISPAFTAPNGRDVGRIVRASLTNAPNLTLTHLHSTQETSMDLAKVRRALGLPEDATDAAVEAAIERAAGAVTLHSQQVADAAGVDRSLRGDGLISAVRAKLGTAGDAADLQRRVEELQRQAARTAAEKVVDDAVRSGRAISDPLRAELISLHATKPDAVAVIINGLPNLKDGGISQHTQRPGGTGPVDGAISDTARLLGIDGAKLRDAHVGRVG